MTLAIKQLKLQDFRNYEHLDLRDLGHLTVFIGENAVGKTNVIEAIQLMTALSSFRRPLLQQLIRYDQTQARVFARCEGDGRSLDLELSISEKNRKYLLNGKSKRPADLKGLIPAVSFTPDDLNLIKGPAGARRDAIDSIGMQTAPNYYALSKDYAKVARHKSKLLKEEPDPLMIDAINETLVFCGSQLVCYRASLFNRLAPLVERFYDEIAEGRESLSMAYVASWNYREQGIPGYLARTEQAEVDREKIKGQFSAALDRYGAREMHSGKNLVGPQSDRFVFYLDGRDASLFASQGQQRSLVLALKLAEVAFIEEITGQKPVLLLDDVMSELDAKRRNALTSYLFDDLQTFITTTNAAYFDEEVFQRARVIELSGGQAREYESGESR